MASAIIVGILLRQNMATITMRCGERQSIKTADKLAAFIIFLYWVLYENIFFFQGGGLGVIFQLTTLSLKTFLPFGLLAYSGVQLKLISNKYAGHYLIFFVVFLAWIGGVTLFNGDMVEWFKFLPRFVFFIAVLSIFYKSPEAFSLYAKLVITYVLFALLQYVLTYVTGAYNNPVELPFYLSAGLPGLYANITSMMSFPGFSVPILRFAGLWNEPSNASGSAFEAVFLALYLYKTEGDGKWKVISCLCGLAGLLCLSNVGYFALGMALGVGLLLKSRADFRSTGLLQKIFVFVFAIAAILITFFGRTYVEANYVDNDALRAIVGLREVDAEDPYGGRLKITGRVVDYISDHLFGLGVVEYVQSENTMFSGSAPLYWLVTGGVFGLTLLLLRELMIFRASYQLAKKSPEHIYLIQALVAVMSQHLSYGSWMNPNYFVLVAAVIAFVVRASHSRVSVKSRPAT